TRGVLSKMVLGDPGSESLIHGNELLAEIGIVGVTDRDRTGYTIGAVRRVLGGVAPPLELPDGFAAWDVFAGYLVLDALIGNTGGHQETRDGTDPGGSKRLAPKFDHASSLGFQLDDETRRSRLTTRDRNYDAAAYADRAHSRFEGSPHPIDVAAEALRTLGP